MVDNSRSGTLNELKLFSEQYSIDYLAGSLEEKILSKLLAAEVCLGAGKIGEAVQGFQEVLLMDGSNEDAVSHLALLELGLSNGQETATGAERLENSIPDFSAIRSVMPGRIRTALLTLDRLKEHIGSQQRNHLIKAAEQTPFRWSLLLRAFVLQGHLLICSNQFDDALQSYSDALSLLANWDVDVPSFSINIIEAALYGQEYVWLVTNRTEQCIRYYRDKIILKQGESSCNSKLRYIIFNRLAHVLIHAANTDMIKEEVDMPGAYQPRSIFEEAVLLLLIYIHKSATDKNAPMSSERRIEIRRDLAIALYRAERPDLVAQLYRDAVSVNMQNQKLWYKLALALSSANKFAEAFDAVSQSISAFVSIPTFHPPQSERFDRAVSVSSFSTHIRSTSGSGVPSDIEKLHLRRFTTLPCELLPLSAPYIGLSGDSYSSDRSEPELPYEILNRIERCALAAKLCLNNLHKTRSAVDFARHSVQLCLSISGFMFNPGSAEDEYKLPPQGISRDGFSPNSINETDSILAPPVEDNLPPPSHERSLSNILGPSKSPVARAISPSIFLSNNSHVSAENELFSNQLRVLTIMSYHLFGLACSKFASEVGYYSHRLQLQASALDALERAAHLSPKSVSIIFHLALVHADMRKISTALKLVNHVLTIDSGYVAAWHLFALLMSSNRQYTQAIQACDAGLLENPNHFELLLTKAKILIATDRYSEAFALYHNLVGEHFDPIQFSSTGYCRPGVNDDDIGKETVMRPVFSAELLENFRVSRLEQNGEIHVKMADPSTPRYRLLLDIAEAYVSMDDSTMFQDALNCLKAARILTPNDSPWLADIHSAIAYVAERMDNFASAITHHQTALSVVSTHLESVIRMGILQYNSGNYVLSHGLLTAALRQDATSHEAWYHLGKVLRKQNKHEEASEAFLTSLELERSAPIRDFFNISRQLQ